MYIAPQRDGLAPLCDVPLCTPVTEITYCSGPDLQEFRLVESIKFGMLGSWPEDPHCELHRYVHPYTWRPAGRECSLELCTSVYSRVHLCTSLYVLRRNPQPSRTPITAIGSSGKNSTEVVAAHRHCEPVFTVEIHTCI
jgi:hypothetical protein